MKPYLLIGFALILLFLGYASVAFSDNSLPNNTYIPFFVDDKAPDVGLPFVTMTPHPTVTASVTPSELSTATATFTSTPEAVTQTATPGPLPSITPSPTNTPLPANTATPTPPSNPTTAELVIYTWDGNVTQANRGFPWRQPPQQNGNWVTPINYAQGTLYIRTEIVSQPVPQSDMRLQFCFWQELNGDNFALETCMRTMNVPGNSGTIRCWSEPIESMWKKDGRSLDWSRPRYRVAVPIKNGNGDPVSDFNGWDWFGENPEHWYPLNLKATVIVVAQGATFSGWGNYGGGC